MVLIMIDNDDGVLAITSVIDQLAVTVMPIVMVIEICNGNNDGSDNDGNNSNKGNGSN